MSGAIILVLWTIFIEGTCGGCTCDRYQVCDDPLEILNSIKAYPDNYQQLLNAFYPINRAKPSSVIIAYFANYTDPLPEECSLGTYPWRTYPGINYTYHNIYWFMWTTTPIYSIANEGMLLEFGEYLPTVTYYLLFNKSSPLYFPSQIACIKTSLIPDDYPTLGAVTIQVYIMLLHIHYTLFIHAYIHVQSLTDYVKQDKTCGHTYVLSCISSFILAHNNLSVLLMLM